jgi:uncharacterized protein (TIGR02145 family)
MYKINLLFVLLFCSVNILRAQVPPQAFNYSAVARNSSGQPIANTTIGIQLSIIKNSTFGQAMYSENHFVNTDSFGLFNLVVGGGAIQSGSISTIDWSNDNYFLKVAMDATGGNNFLTMGTTQLLSVPYALYAKTAGNIINQNDGDTSATNELQTIHISNDTIFLSNGGFVKLPASNGGSGNGGPVIGTPIFTQGGGVSDIDGNFYPTVIIGSQEWMASNLKTTRYSNGDSVVFVRDNLTTWGGNIGQWCYYNYDSINNIYFGKLYNFFAVADSRNLCPTGWHVPSKVEFEQLIVLIDPYSSLSSSYASGFLMATGNLQEQTGLWQWPNDGANNRSGFSALPGGRKETSGTNFFYLNERALFWSSTAVPFGPTGFTANILSLPTAQLSSLNVNSSSQGLSIRCIRD